MWNYKGKHCVNCKVRVKTYAPHGNRRYKWTLKERGELRLLKLCNECFRSKTLREEYHKRRLDGFKKVQEELFNEFER